jgi:hypothetical protein
MLAEPFDLVRIDVGVAIDGCGRVRNPAPFRRRRSPRVSRHRFADIDREIRLGAVKLSGGIAG